GRTVDRGRRRSGGRWLLAQNQPGKTCHTTDRLHRTYNKPLPCRLTTALECAVCSCPLPGCEHAAGVFIDFVACVRIVPLDPLRFAADVHACARGEAVEFQVFEPHISPL